MADGKVVTGYSYPFVALYSATQGVVTYTNGMPLARGVSVQDGVESGDSQDFYANNVLSESAAGKFRGGEITLTIDGLKKAARKMIMGLPETTPVTVGEQTYQVTEYDNRMNVPYVGVGMVIRYMEDGVTSYDAVVFNKGIFNVDPLNAATETEDIEFQTTDLTLKLLRDDTTNHGWRRLVEDIADENEAYTVVKALLGVEDEGA